MSSEEFWKDDPQLFVSYRTSFINKKKREMEELDYKCWLQGLYIYKATLNSEEVLRSTLVNMFSSKKQNIKIEEYPKKPLSELNKEEKQRMDKNRKNSEKYINFQNSLCYFGSMKQRYLDNLEKKREVI